MSSPDSADLTDAALTRLVLRAVGAVIALLLAAGLVAVAERVDRDKNANASSADGGDDGDGTDDPALAVPARGIGPLPGQPIQPYIQARTTELTRARGGERVAVVSFTEYAVATEVDVDADVDVEALLVAAPGGAPTVVDSVDDMDAWARLERKQAAEERTELQRLLPTVEDADFARSYREDIARLDALERSVHSAGEVVFGAVVAGPLAELRRLVDDPSVRLVDVGRVSEVLDHDEVVGLRPEEIDKAGEPRYRPATQ